NGLHTLLITKLVPVAFGNEACLYSRLLTATAANLFALERPSNNRIPGSFSTPPPPR
ncbi:uncharacterized protein K441DRAFT_669398, partial [Cenococcum geophilum 1.58]